MIAPPAFPSKTEVLIATKASNIQKISTKIIRPSNADKYAGKHSAEVVVDRSKLPVSMQNTSPSLEVLSMSSSTNRNPSSESVVNEDLGINGPEYENQRKSQR